MSRPNLVLFMPDQLRADAVGAFGSPVAHTPNIDALARRGTRWTDCYAQHSVCGPSRVSLFTGWYPHVAGHRTLTNLIKPWQPNLLKMLRDDGYNVAWAGMRGDTFAPGGLAESTDFAGFTVSPRMLHQPSPYERDHRFARAFYSGRRADEGPALDHDEAAVQTAEAWLADRPREPWVLFVAVVFPHPPFEVEEPWYSLHDRSAMPAPLPKPTGAAPKYVHAINQAHGLDRLDADDWAEVAATYHGMVSRVDDQLGRVLRSVDAIGASDRTVTAFFTDHGEYLGDYGLVEKWPSGLHRCLLQNPLVLAGPGIPEDAARDAPSELIDLFATILELSEVEAAHTHFGRSLLTGTPRQAAFSEGGFTVAEEPLLERGRFPYDLKAQIQHDDPTTVGRAIALRTPDWTYIHRLYEPDELYDRRADPHELGNLAGSAAVAETERDLRDLVLRWCVETSDVIPWQPDPRFG
jgi:arylsulfatase A-like enzyme